MQAAVSSVMAAMVHNEAWNWKCFGLRLVFICTTMLEGARYAFFCLSSFCCFCLFLCCFRFFRHQDTSNQSPPPLAGPPQVTANARSRAGRQGKARQAGQAGQAGGMRNKLHR
eukprot:COSAG06_NODE_216_length_20108_cov_9.428857_6_plen_113_part_00